MPHSGCGDVGRGLSRQLLVLPQSRSSQRRTACPTCSSTDRLARAKHPQSWRLPGRCTAAPCKTRPWSSTPRTTEASTSCGSRSRTLPAHAAYSGECAAGAAGRAAATSVSSGRGWCHKQSCGIGQSHPLTGLWQTDLSCCCRACAVPVVSCSNKFKLVILDECDAMTRDAQFALRRGACTSPGHSAAQPQTGFSRTLPAGTSPSPHAPAAR